MTAAVSHARAEGQLIIRAMARRLPDVIDGKEAILAMKAGGSTNWRQMEWIGFFPEFWFERNLAVELDSQVGPKFGNVVFDVKRQFVWDLKAHSQGANHWAPLNDVEAVTKCIVEFDGVGFLVVSGPCDYDTDGQFKRWHDEVKGGRSKYSLAGDAVGRLGRTRKTSFRPNHLLAFRFATLEDLNRAQGEGWIRGFQKGMRNSNDQPRREKIMVNLESIPSWALIDEVRR